MSTGGVRSSDSSGTRGGVSSDNGVGVRGGIRSGVSSGASGSGLASGVARGANRTSGSAQLQHGRGMPVADDGWNDEHSGPAVQFKPHKKHKFSPGAKDCAEVNTERFADEQMVTDDNWVGGFYMEIWVDGWDVDKTVTIDFHTREIEFPKHACQNVRVRRAKWRSQPSSSSTSVSSARSHALRSAL